MHWKREPKSHYISLAVAVAAESHYSSLTVSKRAAELVFAEHPRPPPHHAPLAGNCLILQQAGGETAATPVHVSLSWVGVCFGVTHKCCLGSSRGAPPEGRRGSAAPHKLSSAVVTVLECGCCVNGTGLNAALQPSGKHQKVSVQSVLLQFSFFLAQSQSSRSSSESNVGGFLCTRQILESRSGNLIVITNEQQHYWISMNIWKKFEIKKCARPLFS